MASLQELSEGFETIDSKRVFEMLRNYFPLADVELYMFDLAEQSTVRIYIGMSGYQIDWAGYDDWYSVL